MKKILLFLFFMLPTTILIAQNTYYVSSSEGNDTNSGTSTGQPWKTLTKVNNSTFSPGDNILFKRGDSWSGTLNISSSGTSEQPIIYGDYGTGEKPKICGSKEINNWIQHSGNIYKTYTELPIEQLFIDGVRAMAARTPNTGYYYIDTKLSSEQFYSNDLDSTINYVGAKWFGRTNYWLADLRDIIVSTSQTLTLATPPEGELKANSGFFLINKLSFLDQAGEWYYDSQTDTIYLWTPNGDHPVNYRITGSIYLHGIYSDYKDYITIKNLDIREQDSCGICLRNAHGLVIKNNDIKNTHSYGINFNTGGLDTIANNKITHSNGSGIWTWAMDSSHIYGNTIDSTATFNKIGLRGTTTSNGGSGAVINGTGNIVEYNVIKNSNYNGLFYRGSSIIQYNFIKNSCLVKDDGGGIYTNTGGSNGVIRNNIITNTYGNHEGYIASRGISNGIYIDGYATNVIVEHNTILNTNNAGISLHNVENIGVRFNTIVKARYGLQLSHYTGTTPSELKNNLIYLTTASDDYEPRSLLISANTYYAELDSNTYINPYASSGIIKLVSSYLNFSEWQSNEHQDSLSTFDGTPLQPGEIEKFYYNATPNIQNINLGDTIYRDVYGNNIYGTLTLEKYTSKVLIKTNNVKQRSEYKFEEASGDTVFDSQGANHGSIYNSANRVKGIEGNGLKFDTDSAYINLGHSFNDIYTSLTLKAWIKPAIVDGHYTGVIMHGGQNIDTYAMYVNSDSKSIGFKTTGTTNEWANASGLDSLWNGEWHQITVTYDGSQKVIYLDTIAVLTVSATDSIESGTGYNLLIAAGRDRPNHTLLYKGFIDEVEIYNYALDSAEIIDMYSHTDLIIPTILDFSIPSTSNSLTIPIDTFLASDNLAISGYKLTENPGTPLASDTGWVFPTPQYYTFSEEGNKVLYAWVKDSASNISFYASDTTNIILPKFSEYKFEEASGDTVFDSQGINHGVIYNSANRVKGIEGNGLKFDTDSAYINLGNSFNDIYTSLTLKAWIKPAIVDGHYTGVVMHGGPNIDTYAMYVNSDSKSIGFKTTGTTNEWANASGLDSLWNGEWHQIAVTYDGSQKIIYLDTIAVLTVPATDSIESGAGYNLLIAAGRDRPNHTLLYKGLIDEVKIYNYVLDSLDIINLYSYANTKSQRIKTSVTDITLVEDNLKIYPNPTDNYINLEYSVLSTNTKMEIFDSYGHLMIKQEINSSPIRVDISKLSPGLYIIRTTDKTNTVIKKFIVK